MIQHTIKVQSSNAALVLAIKRAKDAGTVIIRFHGIRKENVYRMLDEKLNPLATLKARDKTFLIHHEILLPTPDPTRFVYNHKVKIETV